MNIQLTATRLSFKHLEKLQANHYFYSSQLARQPASQPASQQASQLSRIQAGFNGIQQGSDKIQARFR